METLNGKASKLSRVTRSGGVGAVSDALSISLVLCVMEKEWRKIFFVVGFFSCSIPGDASSCSRVAPNQLRIHLSLRAPA